MFGVITKINWLYDRIVNYPLHTQKELDEKVKNLRKKDMITIAFVTMNVAMWKYQALYDLLKKNPRYKLYIIISPSVKFSRETMIGDVQAMRGYFEKRSMEFVDWDVENNKEPEDIKQTINPDILFYTQPGMNVFTPKHSFQHFRDKLICYTPYGFYFHNTKSMYDRPFYNTAWKLYYYTDAQRRMAKKYSRTCARNVKQLDKERFPGLYRDAVDPVVDLYCRRFPVIRPEYLFGQKTVGKESDDQNSQSNKKRDHLRLRFISLDNLMIQENRNKCQGKVHLLK